MKRTFIGIKVTPSDKLKDCIADLKQGLGYEGINWVPEENFHITLKFLGKTPPDQIRRVSDFLENFTIPLYGFSFAVKDIGFFTRHDVPNVLWAGIDETENLAYLHRKISEALSDRGISKEESSFKPHLTLARMKNVRNLKNLKKTIAPYKDIFFQEELVSEIVFYESILSPEGAKYIPIVEFPLG